MAINAIAYEWQPRSIAGCRYTSFNSRYPGFDDIFIKEHFISTTLRSMTRRYIEQVYGNQKIGKLEGLLINS